MMKQYIHVVLGLDMKKLLCYNKNSNRISVLKVHKINISKMLKSLKIQKNQKTY